MNKENTHVSVTHPQKLKNYLRSSKLFLRYLYNPETREVIGRDGLSWFKISVCYFVFYAILGSFFVGLLAIFAAQMSRVTPTYYSEKSVMANARDENSGKIRLNPGLGFRPQTDPESPLIGFNMLKIENENSSLKNDIKRLKKSLENFFEKNYNQNEKSKLDCSNLDASLDEIREIFALNSSYCKYDYKNVLKNTNCSAENNYGYSIGEPCVAIKLNKIYNWLPEPYENQSFIPSIIRNETFFNSSILQNNLFIKCFGEFAADIDALNKADISYYSAESKHNDITNIGMIPYYYFPYLNQPGYEAPLVFVHFKNIPVNRLINILCKAFANNIDSDDKMNLRGMTQLQLFIEKF